MNSNAKHFTEIPVVDIAGLFERSAQTTHVLGRDADAGVGDDDLEIGADRLDGDGHEPRPERLSRRRGPTAGRLWQPVLRRLPDPHRPALLIDAA